MLDFTKLWDKRYLFGPNPFDLTRSDYIFLGIAIACVALAFIAKIIHWRAEKESPRKILFSRLFHLFLTTGLLLGLWYGARVQRIPWIYTHFTALLILVISLAWFGFIARFYWKRYRALAQSWKEEKIKFKYLAR